MTIYLTGLSTRAGSEFIRTEDIAKKFGKGERNVYRCGTQVLYRYGSNESLESVSCDSSRKALDQSGVSLKKLTGIYACVGNFTSEYLMPGLARRVGENLGVGNIPMITMSMGCAGGIHAMQAAYNQLMVDATLRGESGNALVIVGDHISRALDKERWDTAGIFSDGVAALVLSTENRGRYNIEAIRSTNLPGEILSMKIENPSGEKRPPFSMDGKKVLNFAYKETYPEILKALDLTNLGDRYFIPHQASGIVLRNLKNEYELSGDQIYTDGISSVGNMVGASVFFGLEDVMNRGLAGEKDVILGAFGGELAVGAALLEYQGKRNSESMGLASVQMVLG